MPQTYDVFLSYPPKGRDWARQVAERLQKQGFTVWFDEEQIKPGDEWGPKTLEGLTHSTNIVFLVDADAAKSNNMGLELGVALGQGKRIIPVVDEGVSLEQIPGPLRRRQHLLRGEPVANVKEIAETIGTGRN